MVDMKDILNALKEENIDPLKLEKLLKDTASFLEMQKSKLQSTDPAVQTQALQELAALNELFQK
jgi:hypothetical protein